MTKQIVFLWNIRNHFKRPHPPTHNAALKSNKFIQNASGVTVSRQNQQTCDVGARAEWPYKSKNRMKLDGQGNFKIVPECLSAQQVTGAISAVSHISASTWLQLYISEFVFWGNGVRAAENLISETESVTNSYQVQKYLPKTKWSIYVYIILNLYMYVYVCIMHLCMYCVCIYVCPEIIPVPNTSNLFLGVFF